jgi:hypothetical protein
MVESAQGQLRGAKPPTRKSSATAGGPQPAASSGAVRMNVSDQVLETMIREAAYFRAEQRAFVPGNEFEDWFAAEREIDAMLAPQRPGAVSGQ